MKTQNILNYSITENPLGTPKQILRQFKKEAKSISRYKENTYEASKLTLAKHHKIFIDNLILSDGIFNLFHLIIQTLRPRKTVIPMPANPEYKRVCQIYGSEVVSYRLKIENNLKLDVDLFLESIPIGTDLIILNNPNNPTGRIIDNLSIKKILEYCQIKGIYIIIDESFADFTNSEVSAIPFINKYANLVIVRSLCEIYSICGVGAAYVAASESIIELLALNQPYGQISNFENIIFENAYKDIKFINDTKKYLEIERKRFCDLLNYHGNVKIYPPSANFILVKLQQALAGTLSQRLISKGVIVKSAANFEFLNDYFFRIAIKDKNSNNKFYDKFSNCLI